MEKLIESWVMLKTSDSQRVDLPFLVDSKENVVKVYDYQGQELNHNAKTRSVRFKDKYWYY